MQGQPLVSARIYNVNCFWGAGRHWGLPLRMNYAIIHTWKKQYTTVPFEPFKLKLANKNNIVRKNALFLQTNIFDIQPFIKV